MPSPDGQIGYSVFSILATLYLLSLKLVLEQFSVLPQEMSINTFGYDIWQKERATGMRLVKARNAAKIKELTSPKCQ